MNGSVYRQHARQNSSQKHISLFLIIKIGMFAALASLQIVSKRLLYIKYVGEAAKVI